MKNPKPLTHRANGTFNPTHGMTRTATYVSWKSMIARCFNPKDPEFKNYQGRGITVCERWKFFENFLQDMGVRPEGMTLDRKDNDGNYEPANCRWATRMEQRNNSRQYRRIIEHNGISLSLSEWARSNRMQVTTLWRRLKNGMPISQALSCPVKNRLRTKQENHL